MRWLWWRRSRTPPSTSESESEAERAVSTADAALAIANGQLHQAKTQERQVTRSEMAARVQARQTDKLARDVDRVLRLRGTT